MTNDMNTVTVIGNLTRDCDFKMTTNGFAVSAFSIAVSRSKKQSGEWVNETSYFDCVLYGKQAEALQQYLKKGKKVAVEGYLKQDRWQAPDGTKKSRVVIGCENVQLLGAKNSSEGGNYANSDSYEESDGNYGGDADYGFNN